MKFICKKCGSTEYKIIEKSNGNGIATGLYCAKCGQWQKWLNKQEKVLFADDINDNRVADKDNEIARLKAENAELRRQVEVLERAGKIIQRDMVRVFDVSDSHIRELVANIWNLAKKQAEKELQEEKL